MRLALSAASLLVAAVALAAPPAPHGAVAEPVDFDGLAGWDRDDVAEAFAVFRRHCASLLAQRPELRAGAKPPPALLEACARAIAAPDAPTASGARAFFQQNFRPYRIRPVSGAGFLTGYFEPETEGALTPTAGFSAPVYGRPSDLVNVAPGEHPPGLDSSLAAARRVGNRLEPFPDRAAIYGGALRGHGLEQLYLRDEPEVFIIQVQGSARVRLAEGGQARLTYAGRTGHPYTSIGRILIEEGKIRQEEMSLSRLMGWLSENPAEARRIMERNRSYVFFQRVDAFDPALGPTGGAGVPLTAGRSLAVDRTIWAYGLPVWIGASVDTLDRDVGGLNRLVVAQDTGSAIVGPARADYFWGTGSEAGRRAGLTRHPLEFTVFWPQVR